MKKYRSTSPSRYFERQSNAHAPVRIEFVRGMEPGEGILLALATGAWAFGAGMLTVALMAGWVTW